MIKPIRGHGRSRLSINACPQVNADKRRWKTIFEIGITSMKSPHVEPLGVFLLFGLKYWFIS